VLKNEQHLKINQNFDHQMYLSKRKCWDSNNCLHFLRHALPLALPEKYGSGIEAKV
jgi:hypothetical protein